MYLIKILFLGNIFFVAYLSTQVIHGIFIFPPIDILEREVKIIQSHYWNASVIICYLHARL